MDFHDEHFCNDDWPYVEQEPICTNKTEWLSHQDPSFSDPHNCQSSCSSPGPDCVACTNPDYFICTKSGQCVHPDLVCDGHPQCPGGEDEDLEKCYTDYVNNLIIEPFASYRCTSMLYEQQNMQIFAAPCNGKKECADDSDESGCHDNPTTTLVLTISLLTVLLVFLALRYFRGCFISKAVSSKMTPMSTEELLKKFENNLTDSDIVQEINLHLLHSINTQGGQQKEDFVKIFDFLEAQHNKNEAEMYVYLHKHFDPLLVQMMFNAKFPGLKDSIIKIVDKIAKRSKIDKVFNFFAKKEMFRKIKENILAFINIEMKYLDIFKDLGLTILILQLIGGPQAIIDLPTNFGSVIVISMLGSIFIPMLLSSLNLLVHNLEMFLPKKDGKFTKLDVMKAYLKAALFFLLSPLHPVFLGTLHLELADEARVLAENYNVKAVQKNHQCRIIKKQLIKFVRIELGKFKYV